MKYYSDLTDKIYEKEEDLQKAEESYKKVLAEKNKKTEERKLDAKAVDDAIKNRDELVASGRKKKNAAYEEYLVTVNDAKKKFEKICREVEKANFAAEKDVKEKLKNFCEKNPSGYHSTIKYEDGSTRSYSYSMTEDTISLPDVFERVGRIFWF